MQERGGCEEKEVCTQGAERRETVGEFPLVPFSGLLDLDYLCRQNYLLEKIVAWASQRELMFPNPPSATQISHHGVMSGMWGEGGYLSDQKQQLSVVQKHLKAETV